MRAVVAAVDALLGWLPPWRWLRGGVWECWRVAGRARWFGRYRTPYGERLLILQGDASMSAVLRMHVAEANGVDPSALSYVDLAKPKLVCEGLPVVEVRR